MILVRRPTLTRVGTVFVLLIALLHPTLILSLLIIGEEVWQSISFAKISEDFPGKKRPSNSKYFRKIKLSHFYKREINRLQTLLLLFIEICVKKRHFPVIEMFIDLLSAPTPTVIKQPPRNVIFSRSQPPNNQTSTNCNFFLDYQLSFLIRCPLQSTNKSRGYNKKFR